MISGKTAGTEQLSRESSSFLLSSFSESDGIQEEKKSQNKRKSRTELFDGENDAEDDWPENFVEQFWRRYPPFRRSAKKTVASKLASIRRRGEVTWAKLMDGLERYVSTDPGEFAKGPVVWLNGGCWDDEIQQRRGSNAATGSGGPRGGFSSIGAQIRNAKHTVPGA